MELKKRILAAALAALMLAGCGTTDNSSSEKEKPAKSESTAASAEESKEEKESEADEPTEESADTSEESSSSEEDKTSSEETASSEAESKADTSAAEPAGEDNEKARAAIEKFMECGNSGDYDGMIEVCGGVIALMFSEEYDLLEGEIEQTDYKIEFAGDSGGDYRYLVTEDGSRNSEEVLFVVRDEGEGFKIYDMITVTDEGESSLVDLLGDMIAESAVYVIGASASAITPALADGVYKNGDKPDIDSAIDVLMTSGMPAIFDKENIAYTVTVKGDELSAVVEFSFGGRVYTASYPEAE